MKYKKYKKVKNALIAGASSGIVAGMILMGSSNTALADSSDMSTTLPAYSESTTLTSMHMMHRWTSPAKINTLAAQLGLDPQVIKQEINSGKTMKQILQDNGIVPSELQQAYGKTPPKGKKNWKL